MSRRPIASRLRPGPGARDLLVWDALAGGRREGGFFVLRDAREPAGRSAAEGAALAAGSWRDGPVKTKGRREGVSGAGAGAGSVA